MFMASQIYVASVYGVKYCWFIMALDPVYQFSKNLALISTMILCSVFIILDLILNELIKIQLRENFNWQLTCLIVDWFWLKLIVRCGSIVQRGT